MNLNSIDRVISENITYVLENGHTFLVENKTVFTDNYGEFNTFHISCANIGIKIILHNGACVSNIRKDIVVMQDLVGVLRKVDPAGVSYYGDLMVSVKRIENFNNDTLIIKSESEEVLKDFLTYMFNRMKIDKKSPLFWVKERLINNNLY